MRVIYLEDSQIPPQLSRGYDGKKFQAHTCEQVTIPADAGLWSGGTRDTYRLVELATGREMSAADHSAAPWDDTRKDRLIALKPGFTVIRHSIFCGKDMGLHFYVHPDDAVKLLPAPNDLSLFERIVLQASAELKSSYNGKDRYEMMRDNMTWEHSRKSVGMVEGEAFPTRAQWDEAKAGLIAKGLLDKRGAVTVKGRNANERA